MTGNSDWKRYGSGYSSTSAEVKSHSSVLFNERVNMMFIMYDDIAIHLETSPDIKKILKAKSILAAIWRSVRPLVSNNPKARHILGMDTDKPGIYTADSGFAHVQECITEMITYKDYTYPKLMYTVQQIQNVETIIKEVLQFFSYFIRTEFKQIPDINIAGQKYKGMADERTVQQFNELLGENTKTKSHNFEKELGDEYFDDLAEYLTDENAQDKEDEEEFNDSLTNLDNISKEIKSNGGDK